MPEPSALKPCSEYKYSGYRLQAPLTILEAKSRCAKLIGWESFKARLSDGDEIWACCSPLQDAVALFRNQEMVFVLVTHEYPDLGYTCGNEDY